MTISSASLKSSSGNPSTLRISALLCESVNAGDFFHSQTKAHKKMMRQKSQRHMVMPSTPHLARDSSSATPHPDTV